MSKFFFGLDIKQRPVYLDGKQARLNKVIPAATRAGKGVSVQMLVPQFVLAATSRLLDLFALNLLLARVGPLLSMFDP